MASHQNQPVCHVERCGIRGNATAITRWRGHRVVYRLGRHPASARQGWIQHRQNDPDLDVNANASPDDSGDRADQASDLHPGISPLLSQRCHSPASPLTTSPQQIAIIGAGIAGAQVARQLVKRGCRVRVFDAACIATGASCQSQGITYTRVSHKFGKLPDFAGLSFVHAVDTYQQLIDQGELEADKQVQLNGYLQLVKGGEQQAHFETVLSDPQGHATLLSSMEASAEAGVEIDRPAVFFPTGAGSIFPNCVNTLRHKNITSNPENTGALTLKPSSGQSWLLVDSEERVIARESQVVLATAYDTNKQVDLDWLPLQPIQSNITD